MSQEGLTESVTTRASSGPRASGLGASTGRGPNDSATRYVHPHALEAPTYLPALPRARSVPARIDDNRSAPAPSRAPDDDSTHARDRRPSEPAVRTERDD